MCSDVRIENKVNTYAYVNNENTIFIFESAVFAITLLNYLFNYLGTSEQNNSWKSVLLETRVIQR